MTIGEVITITRLESGLYAIDYNNGAIKLVGDAASTAVTLIALVFTDEANETLLIKESKS